MCVCVDSAPWAVIVVNRMQRLRHVEFRDVNRQTEGWMLTGCAVESVVFFSIRGGLEHKVNTNG